MTTKYEDEDLVYVDPIKKVVIGYVEWKKDGSPKQIQMEDEKQEEGENKKIRKKKRYYPWGTYKTMKKIYKLEGKEKELEKSQTLDQAIKMAVKEPFW